ncbi:MAG: hypothetical protein KBT06_11870 [Prevotellaceae bacterium]|nr:hypothetical protein [Candidatus Colivivens equi]
MNEDVIFPKKSEDSELLPSIPKDISEVGDYLRDKQKEKGKELLKKLENDNELIN